MPRFPLEELPPSAPPPAADPAWLPQIIAWMREMETRVRKLELTVNLDPNEPAQVLGLPLDEQDADPSP